MNVNIKKNGGGMQICAQISNYIYMKLLDVFIYTYHNFNGGSNKRSHHAAWYQNTWKES